MAGPRCDVDDGVGALLDRLHERLVRRHGLVRPAGLRIAGVQMDDGGAGLGRADRRRRDPPPRSQGSFVTWKGVNRTGHGAGDDDFPFVPHVSFVSFRNRAYRGLRTDADCRMPMRTRNAEYSMHERCWIGQWRFAIRFGIGIPAFGDE
jgi:hypothetical protein